VTQKAQSNPTTIQSKQAEYLNTFDEKYGEMIYHFQINNITLKNKIWNIE
jgi:hypothetical protein